MCYSDHFFAKSLYPSTPAKIQMINRGTASLVYVHVNSERISISRSLEARPNTVHLVHEATVLFVKLPALHVPIMSRVPLRRNFCPLALQDVIWVRAR